MRQELYYSIMSGREDEKFYSGWNYRVIRHIAARNGEDFFAIHEVFYDKNGVPCSVTASPVSPQGETCVELLEDMRLMQEATEKPTLDYVLFSNLE